MGTLVINFSKHGHGGFAATTGVLRAILADEEEGLRCKVQTCTKEHHPLKDCPEFGKIEPRDRLVLVKLCLDCLTSDHSRAAKACPFKEERADACKRMACEASHHHLLHIDGSRGKRNQGKRPDSLEGSPAEKPLEALLASQ
jgi:hypothetical protein